MNGHCSKATVISIVYTMENIFVLIFSLFREYVCLKEIAEHEGHKTELPIFFFFFFFFFLRTYLFFSTVFLFIYLFFSI